MTAGSCYAQTAYSSTRARAQALKGEKPVRGLRCSARFRGARAGFLAVPGFLGTSRDRGAVGAQVKERAWRAQGQNADCQPQNVTDTRTKCVFRTRFPARARGRGLGFCLFFYVGFPVLALGTLSPGKVRL